MALLTFEYDKNDFDVFMRLAAALPVMTNQALGFVGNESKKILKKELLLGQALQYRDQDGSPSTLSSDFKDKKGRPKASYGIRYGQYVTIRSYPANFFTVSNTVQRKREIWKRLKMMTSNQLASIIKEFDKKYLQDEITKFTDSPRSRQRF